MKHIVVSFQTFMLLSIPMCGMSQSSVNDEDNFNRQLADTSVTTSKSAFGDYSFELDEVVVLGQPKETRQLRRQPLSSTSFSASDVHLKGFSTIHSLADFTPSFAMPQYGSRITASPYMRGVGSRVGGAPVAMYIDGMPIMNKSAFNTYLYGVDRVDVLRGAQGTLYGQNSESGLIRFGTKSPMNYQGLDLLLSGATGGEYKIEGESYTRLSEKVTLSLGGFFHGSNGRLRNVNLHQRADSLNEAGGRLRLVLKPRHNLTFDVVTDYQHVGQVAFPYGLAVENGDYAAQPSTTYPNTYRRDMFRGGLNLEWQGRYVNIYSTTSYQYLKDDMFMDLDYLAADYVSLHQKQLHNAITEELVFRSSDRQNANRDYQWVAGVFGSYQWLKTVAPVYFGSAITTPISTGIRNAMYNAMVQSMKQAYLARGMSDEDATAAAEQMIEQRGGVSMYTTMDTPGRFHTPEYNVALYHESTYRLLPRLTVVAGLRYDYSHVNLRYDTKSSMAMTANVMGTEATYVLHSLLKRSISNHFSQLLPKIGLTYTSDSRGSNLYALISKGYRAGGYNMQIFSDVLRKELNDNSSNAMRGSYEVEHSDEDYRNIAQTISYKPEVSWNYEAGLHQNITLCRQTGDKLRFDASVFFMQVKNQQLSVLAGNYGYGRSMVNAGRSNSCGLEMSLEGLMLNTRLLWGLNYSYTHAMFRNYTDEITTSTGTEMVSYKGRHIPFIPQHMLSAHAGYRIGLDKMLAKSSLFIGVNTTMQGKTYWNETNTRWQSMYALLGANALLDLGDYVQVALWARNITKTKYNTFLVESSAAGEPQGFAQRGIPRQIGIDVRFHF